MHGARLAAGREERKETQSQEQGRERYEGKAAKRGRLRDESREQRQRLIRCERHGRTN